MAGMRIRNHAAGGVHEARSARWYAVPLAGDQHTNEQDLLNTGFDVYGHLLPDQDETTRAAVSSVMATRGQNLAANSRPSGAVVKRFPLSEAPSAQTS